MNNPLGVRSTGPCFPLLGLTPSGLFMGLSSTLIYTSELILCSTIYVPSATRHNIHMYFYKLILPVTARFPDEENGLNHLNHLLLFRILQFKGFTKPAYIRANLGGLYYLHHI